MKHTKGNWNYKKVGIRFFIGLENYPNEVRTDTNAGYICEIGKGMERTALTEQDEANAKLICAAPSMLETLQEVHKRLRAFELELDNRPDAISEADREIIIDIDLGVIAAINAATETSSNMHEVFAEALKPFGIK